MVVVALIAVALLASAQLGSPLFAQEKTKIYLGASSKTLGYSPLWVATKKAFFDQQGLDVQLVLLRGGGHQHRLALAFAGFQRHTRVAHFAREHEAFEIGQRFVDDDRTQSRGFVHHILPVRFEIPRRRLLDIENPPEAFGRPGANLAETFEDVLDVGTTLVEIQAIGHVVSGLP